MVPFIIFIYKKLITMGLFKNVGIGSRALIDNYIKSLKENLGAYMNNCNVKVNKDLSINLESLTIWSGENCDLNKIFPKYITFNRICDLDLNKVALPADFFSNIKNIRNLTITHSTLYKDIKFPGKMTGKLHIANSILLDENLNCCENIKKLDSIILNNTNIEDISLLPEKITQRIEIRNIGTKFKNCVIGVERLTGYNFKQFTIGDLINSRWDYNKSDKGIKIDLRN